MRNNSALAYQMAAGEGASHLGLLVLVYDAIAGHLIKAADAVRENNIALRCSRSSHVLLLAGHLESWLDLINEPELTASLRQFYAMLRQWTLQLQAAPDSGQYEELAALVAQTRAAWQARERALSAVIQTASADQHPPTPESGRSVIGVSSLQLNA